jgi:hypothetical protein
MIKVITPARIPQIISSNITPKEFFILRSQTPIIEGFFISKNLNKRKHKKEIPWLEGQWQSERFPGSDGKANDSRWA